MEYDLNYYICKCEELENEVERLKESFRENSRLYNRLLSMERTAKYEFRYDTNIGEELKRIDVEQVKNDLKELKLVKPDGSFSQYHVVMDKKNEVSRIIQAIEHGQKKGWF